jgi:serine/threonine-protein kinase OSR1/STK39
MHCFLVFLNFFFMQHRKISGANFLSSHLGIVKLGDFGLIKNLALNTSGSTDLMHAPNEVTGTAYWQAPEVLISSVSYGRKADVW